MVDTFRGQIRIRKWPRKRGKPKSLVTQRQVKWFSGASRLAARVWPDQIKLAIIMTKRTGLYPRDLLIRQMSGGIYDIFTGDGVHYQPRAFFRETKMFQGVILELDAGLALPAGTGVFVNWPLPILDTLGFWDVAAPSFITIPEGINVVEMLSGATTTGTSNLFEVSIFGPGLPVKGEATGQGFNVNSRFCSTGPLVVTAGEQYRSRFSSSNVNTTRTDRRAFFALNVLDAD